MIEPFSGKNFHKNAADANQPCVICGKQVDRPAAEIRVVDGGSSFGRMDSDLLAPGYLGVFGIGSGCWNKHRKELLRAGAVELAVHS